MAIYHFNVSTVSRASGRSVIAAAAYRAAEKLYDERTDMTHDYTRKSGVMMAEVITPTENPIGLTLERGHLWALAEESEKRKDSKLAREIVVALPCELNRDEQKALARDYAQGLSQRTGWAVDVAVHEGGRNGDERNVHAHILCTTRRFEWDENGYPSLKEKTRNWDVKQSSWELIKTERQEWETLVNQALERNNHLKRVDCRSHKTKETGLIPLIHLGVSVSSMEKKGIQTERGELYREIVRCNSKVINFERFKQEREEEQAWQSRFDTAKLQSFQSFQRLMTDVHPGSYRLTLEAMPEVHSVKTDYDKSIDTIHETYTSLNQTLTVYYDTVSHQESSKSAHPYLYHLSQCHLPLDRDISSTLYKGKQLERELNTLFLKAEQQLDHVDNTFNQYETALGYHKWFVDEVIEKHQGRYDEGYPTLFNRYEREASELCAKAEKAASDQLPNTALTQVRAIYNTFPKLDVPGVSKLEAEIRRQEEAKKGTEKRKENLHNHSQKAWYRQINWQQGHEFSSMMHVVLQVENPTLRIMQKEEGFTKAYLSKLEKVEQRMEARMELLKQELTEAKDVKTPALEHSKAVQKAYEKQIELTLSTCQKRVEQEQALKWQQEQAKRLERERSWQKEREQGRDHGNYLGR